MATVLTEEINGYHDDQSSVSQSSEKRSLSPESDDEELQLEKTQTQRKTNTKYTQHLVPMDQDSRRDRMDVNRLKSLRAGNRAAVTKNIRKLEDAIAETDVDTEEISSLLGAIEKKRTALETLDEQIVNKTESEDITTEVTETDDYYLELDNKLRKFKKYLKSSSSTNSSMLRTNAPEFIPSTSQTYQRNELSFSSSTSSQNHRLPKLSLPNFNGDILEWQYFWDSFESTVHSNHTLTDVQKFSYLKSLLEFEAASVISGLTLTNLNYQKAIDLLKSRYGQTHKITNAYMRALLDMPAPDEHLESLRSFYDNAEAYIRGLESLGQCQDMFGSLLIPVIVGKLPYEFRRNITRENGSDDWTIQKLRDAICKELSIQESSQVIGKSTFAAPTASFIANVSKDYSKGRTSKPAKYQDKKKSCAYCEGSHHSVDCKDVIEREKRVAIIKEKKLCFNCFGTHRVSDCHSKYDCRICHRKHHTSLCQKDKEKKPESQDQVHKKDKFDASMLYISANQETSKILLKTAVAQVMSGNSQTEANIFFDEGAQRSFISQELATKLEVEIEGSETINITSFADKTNGVRNLDTTTVQIKANNGEIIPIKVLIVPRIASPIQNQSRKVAHDLHYLRGLTLAHPVTDTESFEVSILIGADFYWNVVQDHVIRGHGPTAVSSKLGYLLSGPVPATTGNQSTSMMNLFLSQKMPQLELDRFWKLENMGVDTKEIESNNQMADAIDNFIETSISKEDGKYVSKLPWKDNCKDLLTNEDKVEHMTRNVIRRLSKDEKMFKMYGQIIEDQEKRGFIEKVNTGIETNNRVHYIPHHAVKKDSITTPIRIVYNCSCKSNENGVSLNDCLADYPPMMNELTSILTRFRLHKFAMTADIEKAFLQIVLDAEDRDVTRFFWLKDPTDPTSELITYRFRVVLFGATCSPFILSATLMKHFQENLSPTSTELQRNLYVDNALTSFSDENELLKFYKESRKLLSGGGFNLRSWNSNSEKLRNITKTDNVADNDQIVKILGMRWDTKSDKIMYQPLTLTENSDRKLTKREVLRQSSSVFDPLGLISPVTVKSKLFMQNLWRENLHWDELLSRNLQDEWKSIANDIEQATKTEISRQLTCENGNTEDTSIHIFTDSSKQAYGACAFIVSGKTTKLVMSKNRVAPIKEISLPRLELMGALIGARLAKHILGIIDTQNVHFWCDSQIVLSWMSSTKTLQPFIANRIKEIRKLVEYNDWRYCPTDQNPADCLTRGMTAAQLQECSLWKHGPTWLTDKTFWPQWDRNINDCSTLSTLADEESSDETDLTEIRDTESLIKIENFSSFKKLTRTVAYMLRFIHNLKSQTSERKTGILSTHEIQEARLTLIRNVQHIKFRDEISSLESNTNQKSSIVRQLRLYIDENGLVRCGGRINNAPVDFDTKYPILLPTKHHLTSLIVMDAHHRVLHGGPNCTIAHIHQNYWIPRIRQCVKFHLRKCVNCKRVNGKPYGAPDPPPLPKDRLNNERPFYVTGIDFTGALYTKGPTNTTCKSYICLFTCAATRAVHLEIVNDLTENTFLLAFRRFVARRSLPSIIMSDNATTFKAAAERIQERGTQWKFIPNRAPWFGGYWERLVGLTKTTLKKVLGKSCVTTDMLRTIVTEVECTINNRPITYISTEITDLQALTPSHLLNGRRLDSLPSTIDISNGQCVQLSHSNCNKQYHRQLQLVEHFRSRWRNEYLTSLREFHRVHGNNQQTIQVGDVVHVHSDTNRSSWKLALVIKLISGRDGLTRSAIIKTENGLTNRPITKLYPLELQRQ